MARNNDVRSEKYCYEMPLNHHEAKIASVYDNMASKTAFVGKHHKVGPSSSPKTVEIGLKNFGKDACGVRYRAEVRAKVLSYEQDMEHDKAISLRLHSASKMGCTGGEYGLSFNSERASSGRVMPPNMVTYREHDYSARSLTLMQYTSLYEPCS
ncbi:hypothetical protein KIN20_018774 [Parelaphostrongylus tenuis]|uniref:Uncharacterized protein n=1 Tax=Parelaphostrongylus tenuis TaxID=148309 RepID=A0AAD5MQD6_PARTN|nr:hypothetical protein KIN20_018774 [Parelaphostrongylus tenuis]